MVTKRRHACRTTDLTQPGVAHVIVQALLEARAKKRCYLLAWCLMPDHVHMLLSPREAPAELLGAPVGARSSGRRVTPLSRVVANWASSAAHLVNRVLNAKGPLWQEGFHDHGIRRGERIEDVVAYVHANPVRRGLATQPEQWPWSSANPAYAEACDWGWFVGSPED